MNYIRYIINFASRSCREFFRFESLAISIRESLRDGEKSIWWSLVKQVKFGGVIFISNISLFDTVVIF